MNRLTNTDQVSRSDRQASGNQPDFSTPAGSTPSGVVPPPASGTVTSIAEDGNGQVVLTPDPITVTGTVGLSTVGTAGNYQRVTTNAYGRVTAGQNDVVNVKQYGALGDGSTNDTAAINNAIAAMTSYSTLYFPAGKYLVTLGSLATLSGMDNITVMGDGWSSQLYSSATGAPADFLNIDNTCNYACVLTLSFKGSATMRGNGICLRMYASNSQVLGCWFEGCSDFAMHIAGDAGGTSYSSNVSIIGNHIYSPLGDGIHAGAVQDVLIEGNHLHNTGDDSIALVADDPSFPTVRATVVGNHIYNSGARGIAVLECQGFLVADNYIWISALAGIEVNRFTSTTVYNVDGKVSDNNLHGTVTSAGPIGSINLFWCSQVECSDNLIDSPETGSGIAFLDVLNVVIQDNKMKGIPAYGIRGYDFGAAHVAATQGPLSIKGNLIFDCADYAVYCVADTGATIFNFMVNENEAYAVSGTAKAVFWDKVNTGRIANNTALGFAYTAGGTVTAVTTFNNN